MLIFFTMLWIWKKYFKNAEKSAYILGKLQLRNNEDFIRKTFLEDAGQIKVKCKLFHTRPQ